MTDGVPSWLIYDITEITIGYQNILWKKKTTELSMMERSCKNDNVSQDETSWWDERFYETKKSFFVSISWYLFEKKKSKNTQLISFRLTKLAIMYHVKIKISMHNLFCTSWWNVWSIRNKHNVLVTHHVTLKFVRVK